MNAAPAMHPDQLRDGIYRLESAGAGYMAQTIAIVHAGTLMAYGQFGGLYSGTCRFDPGRKLNLLTGEAQLPPNVPLVTGGKTGPQGAVVPLTAEVKLQGDRGCFSFSLNGHAVDVVIRFVRPLPG